MKKIIAVILAMTLCLALGTNAFAGETSANKETPSRMYNSATYSVPANSTVATSTFYVPDHLFAFEMTGQKYSGGTYSGTYTVNLRTSSGGFVASGTGYINCSTYKIDYISVNPGTYYFTIRNDSNVPIKVTLTYYSW